MRHPESTRTPSPAANTTPPADQLDDEEIVDLARAIQIARTEAQLTQQQIAAMLGTTQGNIARLESGRHLPSTRILQRVARATGTRLRVSFERLPVAIAEARPALRPEVPLMSPDPREPIPFLNWLASRRAMLGATAGLASGAALASTAAAAQTASPEADASPVADIPANGVQPDGSWVFTDDRGITVTLPQAPTRIFADLKAGAPLWDFGITPIGVAGWTVASDIAWGELDRSIPEINAGSDSGLPDPEKLIALQPDLYVAVTSNPDDLDFLWGFPDAESIATIGEIVPIIAISTTGSIDVNTARFAELAELLGADPTAPNIVESREIYDETVAAIEALTAEKSELTALFATVKDDAEWHVANWTDWADLTFYSSLGLNIVKANAEDGAFWEALSREQALAYPTDLFFISTRAGNFSVQELQGDPIFGQHPAIKAGQIGAWDQDSVYSYRGVTVALDLVKTALETATKVS